MNDRVARSDATREDETRDLVWNPPDDLAVPPAPEGYSYRWIRANIYNDPDDANVYRWTRQHYKPVMRDEVPGWEGRSDEDGKHVGVVRHGDLILVKVPLTVKAQRQDYFKKRTEALQRSVDSNLFKENSTIMPIQDERRSEVRVGRGSSRPTEFD